MNDKYNDTREFVKRVEVQVTQMATQEQISKIHETEKTIKQNFELEFERFQEYLKEQNSR